jgi:hypothetical protein
MFDARVYEEAMQPPKFIDRTGKTHVGQILGANHWMHLQVALRGSKTDNFSLVGALKQLVDTMFPHPWWKPGKSVSDMVWELPMEARNEAVWDFIRSQARAAGLSIGTYEAVVKAADLPVDSLTSGSSPDSISTSPDSTTSGEKAGTEKVAA